MNENMNNWKKNQNMKTKIKNGKNQNMKKMEKI